jgi:rubrerythrin
MELGTFGAIFGFAIELEDHACQFYQTAAERSTSDEVVGLFAGYAKAAAKRSKRLARMRRESVTEMILEPISGLHSQDYLVSASVAAGTTPADLAQAAQELELSAARFYKAATDKIGQPEAQRLFQKMERENVRRQNELAAL